MRLALAFLIASCATCPRADEDAIAARVRAEVIAELRSNETRAAEAEPEDEEDVVIEDEAPERYRVPIDGAPARGARAPLVHIVLFSDFQCPFCGRIEPTLARVLDEFPNEVRLVFRHNPLPFHQHAQLAAEASMEAFDQGGDALFWRYHALLFENQRALARSDLETYAQRVGMDMAELRRALDDRAHQPRVFDDQAIVGRLGVRGTPASFVNGRLVLGAQPYEELERIVREEIAFAERAMRRGTPRAAIYASLMRNALERRADAEPPPAPRPMPDPAAVYRVPLDGRPARGPADALVTIVELTDYQCPFCRRAEPTLEQIRQHYGNDVRIVVRNNPLPFHEQAMPAAEAAAEVLAQRGVDAFWRYHDLLFTNQEDLTRPALVRYAVQVGADTARLEQALDDRRHRAAIVADQQLAQSLGATGTPSFFINGRSLRGAQPFEAFRTMIDEELASARRRVESGTPRARLYETIIAHGHTTAHMLPGQPRQAAPEPPVDRVYDIRPPRRAPARGPRTARVTIQIFADFQCPFCNRVRPTIDALLSEYGSRVRLVWRDYPLPFHTNAMPAAEAGREVFRQGGDRAFWQYHDLLFENQQQLDRDTLVRLAAQVNGIDRTRVQRALEDGIHRAAIEADMAVPRDAGANIGTPSFFINGRLLQGAQPIEAFRAAIDRALAER